MNFLISLMLGAGVATFAYLKLGRRAGYGNTKEVTTITAVAFVLSTIFFYTIVAFVIHV